MRVGRKNNPSYEEVCSGSTGHAEVVQISFNPEEIKLANLLSVFFELHDPTTPNRQGADVGSQYRSIVLYKSDTQKAVVDQTLLTFSKDNKFDKPVVTQVQKLDQFFPAENYHQQYFKKIPGLVIARSLLNRKLTNFGKIFRNFENN